MNILGIIQIIIACIALVGVVLFVAGTIIKKRENGREDR